MELYGVDTGFCVGLDGITKVYPVEPSQELLDNISQLPPESKVGVGTTPREVFGDQSEAIGFDPNQASYWYSVINHCHKSGHEVVWLDSEETLNKAIRYAHLFEKVTDKLLAEDPITLPLKRYRQLADTAYALDINVSYIWEVEREADLIKNAKASELAAIVVDQPRADYLVINQEELGIRPSVYWRTKPIECEILLSIDDLSPFPANNPRQHLERGFADQQVVRDRESLLRKYNAVTLGRIMPDRTPTHIGTWTPCCPAEGLFEIYPTEAYGRHYGEVEDSLGLSSFRGSLYETEGRVHFVKEYNWRLDPQASEIPLIYRSQTYVNRQYQGEWGYGQDGVFKRVGKFVMVAGQELFTPTKLDELDLGELLA